jgi:hypothetical protein
MRNALVKYSPSPRAIGASTFAAGFLGWATSSFATATYDLSSVTTGLTDQIQAAVTTGLPIMGGLLALFVGLKVIKRVVKG